MNTAASLFYYLHLLVPTLSRRGGSRAAPLRARPIALVPAVAAAAASVLLDLGSRAVLTVLS